MEEGVKLLVFVLAISVFVLMLITVARDRVFQASDEIKEMLGFSTETTGKEMCQEKKEAGEPLPDECSEYGITGSG